MEDTSRTGGIRALVEVANGLNKRGHECTIILPQGTKTIPYDTQARIVEVGPSIPYIPNLRNFVNIRLLRYFIPPADVLIASSWRSAFPVYHSAKKQGAIGLWYIQADERLLLPSNRIGKAKKRMVEEAYRLPLRWIINSSWLAQKMETEFHHSGVVVNPGVDTETFTQQRVKVHLKRDSDPYTIISIGRSIPIKGLPDLLEALRIVTQQKDIRLVLLSAENLDITAPFPVQVINPGSDREIATWYHSSDLFVYPSWYEGFGLPPLEAMACGIPVVTTDCGGVREYAIHQHNALITPIRDPQSLATAILSILSNPQLANRLATHGIETAVKFTWDQAAAKFERALFDFLGK